MATREIQGANIQFLVRDYGSTDVFQEMVCEETLTFELNNDVNTTKTKCGVFKGIQVADFKANGGAVNNVTPTSTEYSYDELQRDQIGIVKKEFVIQNRAYGAIVAGHEIKMGGAGYFVGSQFTAGIGEVVKFTWNLEGVGTLAVTESV